MRATYNNSFCEDSNCMNYFEYMCAVALAEKGTEIDPIIDGERDNENCKEFIAGTFLAYEIDLGEEE